MFSREEKGFTMNKTMLFMLALVVVGAIVVYVFSNFVESSRLKDAERIISAAVEAQDKYMMSRGRYTTSWVSLNALPLAPYMKLKGDYVSEDGTIFMNKGGGMVNPNNGFKIYFDEIYDDFYLVAERVNGNYHYTLVRPLGKGTTYCIPSKNSMDEKFCMKYMNVGQVSQLPADPRTF